MLLLVSLLSILAVSDVHCSNPSDLIHRLEFLEREWKQAETLVEQQRQQIQKLTEKLQSKEASVQYLTQTLKSRRQSSNQVIGFTARLTKTVAHLNAQQSIVFDKVLTNAGQAYDAQTGIFTCPYSGLYEFAATVVSNGQNKNLDAELVRQGQGLARLHSTLYGFDQGTQVVITRCVEGDRVWVRHYGTADSAAIPGGFSAFAGHLIHMDE